MSTDRISSAMQPVSCGLRAYFAPVRREDEQAAILDPARLVNFDLEAPMSPWIDVGWVDGLRRAGETQFGAARRGKRTSRAAQYRTRLDARLELEFREWGKLQMALSGGSEHFNVLAVNAGGVTEPAVPGITGTTATEIRMAAADLEKFAVGDLVAIDVEYHQETGYLGTGIAGCYLSSNDELPTDPDYVRRITFNVEKIASKSADALVLGHALAGGVPLAAAAVQKVVGFTDREGGKFLQEWSALFVLPEVSGGRIFLHYPRLQPASGGGESSFELAAGLQLNSLKAAFVAMPYTDPSDGEPVLCYRSYILPNGN